MKIQDGKRLPTVTQTGIFGFFEEYRFLSNFEVAPFVLPEDGCTYQSSEHAYMAQKTLDMALRQEIAALTTPAKARKRGQEIPLRADWHEYRVQAMYNAVSAKFSQNPELAAQLLATGDLHLEEANNWGDVFWGTVDGVGENQLGRVLMRVRAELRATA